MDDIDKTAGPAETVPYATDIASMMLSMVTLKDIPQSIANGYALLVRIQDRGKLLYIAPGNVEIRWSPYIFHSDDLSNLPPNISIASDQGAEIILAQIHSDYLESVSGEEGGLAWLTRRVEGIKRPKRGRKGASVVQDSANWMKEVLYALKKDGTIEKEVYQGLLVDGVLEKPSTMRRV